MRVRLGTHVWGNHYLHTIAHDYAYNTFRDNGNPYAASHRGRHANRHARRRWVRKFAAVAAVAQDALLQGDRGRAIGVLTEVVRLDRAIQLCSPPKSISNYVDIAIELLNYPDAPHDDIVDAVWNAPITPYTDDGIPPLQRALRDVLEEYQLTEQADREVLNKWARMYGLNTIRLPDEPDETDDELRARLCVHLMGARA